jgi:hypothetical protein
MPDSVILVLPIGADSIESEDLFSSSYRITEGFSQCLLMTFEIEDLPSAVESRCELIQLSHIIQKRLRMRIQQLDSWLQSIGKLRIILNTLLSHRIDL